MKDETSKWLEYASENLESAHVLLNSGLFNPCLQNAQQAVEKMLKAVLVEFSIKFKKTHSISELAVMLAKKHLKIELAEEECELLDSIYLPSKYPLGSALPDFEPDEKTCKNCIAIAEHVKESVLALLH
ncbi:MAG: HEPN domain-containing protein [Planctomycetota bacterium]|nr:HEPN domain-containing protein [Planctomycetota bacterium]